MIKVVSLFSGCGGLDLGIKGGFHYMGRKYSKNLFNIVFANDMDKDAIRVYKHNKDFFNGHHFIEGDIRDIDIDSIPQFDVLFDC